jgi:hypothetical protein
MTRPTRLLAALIAVSVLSLAFPNRAWAPHGCGSGGCMTQLLGKNEVEAGSPVASGEVTIRLNAKVGRVCWTLKVNSLDPITAVQIEAAPEGKAGIVVVVLFSGKLRGNGCVPAPKSVVAAIDDNPQDYYVNVRTAKYPAGAIRGQL